MFTIRPGFRFSPPSNRPVTARAFKRAIERFVNPRTAAATASEMADLVGYRAYRAGRRAHIAGVSATTSTLTIRLVHAAPSLPARIAMPYFCAVPPGTPIRAGGVERVPGPGPTTSPPTPATANSSPAQPQLPRAAAAPL